MNFSSFESKFNLETQEEIAMLSSKEISLDIALIKDHVADEKRVCLTPKDVNRLVLTGNSVMVESNAGLAAGFSNDQYSNAGAVISHEKTQLLKSHTIIKTSPLTKEEIQLLSPHQVIITFLQPFSTQKDYFIQLSKKMVTALAFELFRDSKGRQTVIKSMSEIAGRASILIAAEKLRMPYHSNTGGVMFGGFSGILPCEIVIIGAGTVAEFACRCALGFGAQITVFDSSTRKLDRIQSLVGQRLSTSMLEPDALRRKLRTTSVLVAAVNVGYGKMPLIVSEDMVAEMPRGSVIVDISIDNGSCVETSEPTSHKQETFEKNGVIHYCVPNIPSATSKTSSIMLSRILTPVLLNASSFGGLENLMTHNEGVKQSIYLYKGAFTNSDISSKHNLSCNNIDLIILRERY